MENKALHLEIENLKGCNSHWSSYHFANSNPCCRSLFFRLQENQFCVFQNFTDNWRPVQSPCKLDPTTKMSPVHSSCMITKSSLVLLWSLVIENNMLKGDSLLENCKCTLPDHVLHVHFRQWKSLLLAAVCLLWHGSCWESSLMPWKWDESHGGEDRLLLCPGVSNSWIDNRKNKRQMLADYSLESHWTIGVLLQKSPNRSELF